MKASLALALCCGLAGLNCYGQAVGAPAATSQQAAPQTPTPKPNSQSDATAKAKAKKAKAEAVQSGGPVRATSVRFARKAAKCYVDGVKMMEKQRYDDAWRLLKEATELEPTNGTYVRAADLARESLVTQLVQESSRARIRGSEAEASDLIERAAMVDPNNPVVVQHMQAKADALNAEQSRISINEKAAEQEKTASAIKLEPSQEKHTFHLNMGSRQVLEQVYKAYGLTPMFHDSVQNRQVRFDVDNAQFAEAARVLGMVTKTFYEPLDPHRVVVAHDTRETRQQFERTEAETVYLPGLDDKALTEVNNVAHNVFDMQQSAVEPSHGTITVRAPVKTLSAFNRTLDGLESGQNQIDLNIKVIQLSHMSDRETGTQFFQTTGLYNAYAELNSIIQQNQSAVQQILSQGLVPNSSTVANQIEIVAILLAAGQLSGTVFNQGFALFGGGLTESILQPSAGSLAFSLTSSDTRTLEDIHLRLSDEEPGTFKVGERYPIETSSFSSVALPSTGLTSAASAALGSLQNQTVPQIQYEDLGLTVKATPKVMRGEDVALTLDMKIVSLGGSSLNNIPVLNNQSFAGVATLKAGETAVLLSDLTRQDSRALNGLPGVSDIPGLEDISDISRNRSVARLLILVTPSVIRGPRAAGRGPRIAVDKAPGSSPVK